MIKFTIRKEDSQAKEQREQYQVRLNTAESRLSLRNSNSLSRPECEQALSKVKVYHGSNVEVQEPLVGIGRQNLDFGEGFYVTALPTQAEEWARNKARYYMQSVGIVSIYDFDFEAALAACRYHKFEHYNREWLHFIVNNRDGGDDWRQWDIIEGGVANDRVIDTVENYRAGLIDEETALGLLSQHQPNHQICIVKQEIVDKYLRFTESYQVKAYVE